MAVLVLFCAALVCTGAALAIPSQKNLRVRQLARAYWVITAVLVAIGLLSGQGRDSYLHFDRLSEHAALGVLLVAIVLVAWTIFCLFNGFGRGGDER